MTTQHTPGRALLDEDEPIVRGEDGERIANCYRILDGDPAKTPEETGMANARRVAAAWNACEGISTEALETDGSAAMGWTRTASKLIHATKQRDELLAALKLIRSAERTECALEYVKGIARAAIAKVEGGAT